MIPVQELWERTMDGPIRLNNDSKQMWEMWLREEIFTVNCWLEVPLNFEEYHLYYRDRVRLVRC